MKTKKLLTMLLVVVFATMLMSMTAFATDITTADALKTALQSNTAQTINVTEDITLPATNLGIYLGASHTLNIASDKTVTLEHANDHGITLGTNTLTITGGGKLITNGTDYSTITGEQGDIKLSGITVEMNGYSHILTRNITVGSGAKVIVNAPRRWPIECESLVVESGGEIDFQDFSERCILTDEFTIKNGGKVNVGVGSDNDEDKSGIVAFKEDKFTVETGATLTGEMGAVIQLYANSTVNLPSSLFKDAGNVFTGGNVTVGENNDTASATGLREGKYVWNGTHFAKDETSFTITFNVNGGDVLTPNTVQTNADGSITTYPTPTRNGHTFLGWYDKDDAKIEAEHKFTSHSTVYAKWEVTKVTVTFDPNGGTVDPTSETIDADGVLTNLPTPTKNGYTFVGWFFDDTFQTPFTPNVAIGDNMTIFAKWQLGSSSTITDVDTAEALKTALESVAVQTINVTDNITLDIPSAHITLGANHTLNIPTGKTVTLQGEGALIFNEKTFDVNGGGTLVLKRAGDSALFGTDGTVNFENITVNVMTQLTVGHSVGNGGITTKHMIVGDGAIINLDAPNVYQLLYLSDSSSALNIKSGGKIVVIDSHNLNSAIDLRGTMTVENGGTFEMQKATSGIYVGNTATLDFQTGSIVEAVTDSYIEFNENAKVKNMGGKISDQGTSFTTDNEVTVGNEYATAANDALTEGYYYYDTNEGKFVKTYYTITVTGGKAYVGNEVTKAEKGIRIYIVATVPQGDTFKEWQITPAVTLGLGYNLTDAEVGFDMPAENVTIVAEFTDGGIPPSTTYTVTFDSDGATTEANPTTKIVTSPTTTVSTLPTPPTKTGFTFGGWYTAINGGGTEFTANTTVSASITVYAKWTAATPTVTGVTVNPLTATVQKGQTQQFTASVQGDNSPVQTVAWTVEGTTNTGTTIADGLLTIAADETAVTLTVKATSTVDNSISGTATVTVSDTAVTKHTITPTAGANGSITPSSATEISEGGSLTFTFTPNSGYEVDKVTVDSGVVTPTNNSYTIPNVQNDMTIHVTFKATSVTPTKYAVTVNGSYATNSGASSYAQGETVTINAGSRSGYSFDGWAVTSGSVILANTNSRTTTFEMPANDVTITATWDRKSSNNNNNTTTKPEVQEPTTDEGTTNVDIEVKPTTSGGNSKVDIPNDTIEEAVKDALDGVEGTTNVPKVSIDIDTPSSADSMEITFGSDTLEDLTNDENAVFEIKSGVGTATFDAEALASILAQADGKDITLTVREVTNLSDAQKQAVGDRPVFEIRLEVGSTYITDFGGGMITVSIPYTLAKDEEADEVAVYHIGTNGELNYKPTTYNATTKEASFTTEHFSTFAIMLVGEDVSQTGDMSFVDVSKDAWYYEDVEFVYTNKFMQGTKETSFEPNSTLTRAMMAQVIWNMEGKPEVSKDNPFEDISNSDWYYDAVVWTVENGIYKGITESIFAPDESITREQLATIFYRYAEYKGYDLTQKGDLSEFADEDKISDWAKEEMMWTVGSELMLGKQNAKLDPQGTATRAEIATMIHRFMMK